MKTKWMFGLLCFMMLAAASANAQGYKSYSDRDRIKQGVKHGSITRAEAHRIGKAQKRHQRQVCKALRNDGHISPRERRGLANNERRTDYQIYRYKHNRYERF